MAKKLYELTPEHRAQLAPWRDRWIANAMSTKAMDEADRAATRKAIRGLYEAANLTPPPDHRIIFVPSPFVLTFAGGFASWIWYLRSLGSAQRPSAATRAATSAATIDATSAATRDATSAATIDATSAATSAATIAATRAATSAATSAATIDATSAATRDATIDATSAATRDATSDATSDATRDATSAATSDATSAATRDATSDATSAATRDATRDATSVRELEQWYTVPVRSLVDLAKEIFGGEAHNALECAYYAGYWRMWDGGNQWSGWSAYISFFRHVAKLSLDYSKWEHYEQAIIHSGPRLMHREFCIVSDRPEVLTVDEQNRPHSDTGPFCRWRDGTALYAVHGARVPAWIIEKPERITAKIIMKEENAEIRRIMIDKMGAENFLRSAKAKRVQADDFGTLYRVDIPGDEALQMVEVENSTAEPNGSFKKYMIRVPPHVETAHEAVAWTWGTTRKQYAPALET